MSRPAFVKLAACALGLLSVPFGCSDEAEPTSFVCVPLPAECPGEAPSYASVVAPIIANNCGQCHNHGDPTGPWPLDEQTDVADWSSSIQLSLADCLMPPRNSDVIMTNTDREALNAWLLCGTPDN